ncbi:linoleoyl-CoA desaturase [Planctomycetaceae bacterium SCGC AG-212-F19]|nr:linoleoyl-CoA desaturase [Planctomycetaceae bacterium SCGC AG-212-F19]
MAPEAALSTLHQAAKAIPSDERLKFTGSNGFHVELRRRVEAYFRTTGQRQRDCPRMYLKTAIVIGWFVTSYVLLVFWAEAWWQAVPLTLSLGLAMSAIGFNIQHDGSHHAYSDRSWVNRLAALSLDLIGVSSFVWHWTHNVVHHSYVNITGHDTDIDLGPLARLSPHQKRRVFHRYQQWYIWPLYCLFTIKWHLFDDFFDVLSGRIGSHRVRRLGLRDRVAFLGGKAISFSLTFGVPLLRHPLGHVLLYYVMVSCVLGFTLSVVFQMAHCVEEAAFPLPQGKPGRIETAWAVHQVQTTVNFSRRSWLAAWFLGGLNFQIEHHLLPRVCHVNYPELSRLVEETCREFGVRYAVHESFGAGLASHYRWLRRMGNPDLM